MAAVGGIGMLANNGDVGRVPDATASDVAPSSHEMEPRPKRQRIELDDLHEQEQDDPGAVDSHYDNEIMDENEGSEQDEDENHLEDAPDARQHNDPGRVIFAEWAPGMSCDESWSSSTLLTRFWSLCDHAHGFPCQLGDESIPAVARRVAALPLCAGPVLVVVDQAKLDTWKRALRQAVAPPFPGGETREPFGDHRHGATSTTSTAATGVHQRAVTVFATTSELWRASGGFRPNAIVLVPEATIESPLYAGQLQYGHWEDEGGNLRAWQLALFDVSVSWRRGNLSKEAHRGKERLWAGLQNIHSAERWVRVDPAGIRGTTALGLGEVGKIALLFGIDLLGPAWRARRAGSAGYQENEFWSGTTSTMADKSRATPSPSSCAGAFLADSDHAAVRDNAGRFLREFLFLRHQPSTTLGETLFLENENRSAPTTRVILFDASAGERALLAKNGSCRGSDEEEVSISLRRAAELTLFSAEDPSSRPLHNLHGTTTNSREFLVRDRAREKSKRLFRAVCGTFKVLRCYLRLGCLLEMIARNSEDEVGWKKKRKLYQTTAGEGGAGFLPGGGGASGTARTAAVDFAELLRRAFMGELDVEEENQQPPRRADQVDLQGRPMLEDNAEAQDVEQARARQNHDEIEVDQGVEDDGGLAPMQVDNLPAQPPVHGAAAAGGGVLPAALPGNNIVNAPPPPPRSRRMFSVSDSVKKLFQDLDVVVPDDQAAAAKHVTDSIRSHERTAADVALLLQHPRIALFDCGLDSQRISAKRVGEELLWFLHAQCSRLQQNLKAEQAAILRENRGEITQLFPWSVIEQRICKIAFLRQEAAARAAEAQQLRIRRKEEAAASRAARAASVVAAENNRRRGVDRDGRHRNESGGEAILGLVRKDHMDKKSKVQVVLPPAASNRRDEELREAQRQRAKASNGNMLTAPTTSNHNPLHVHRNQKKNLPEPILRQFLRNPADRETRKSFELHTAFLQRFFQDLSRYTQNFSKPYLNANALQGVFTASLPPPPLGLGGGAASGTTSGGGQNFPTKNPFEHSRSSAHYNSCINGIATSPRSYVQSAKVNLAEELSKKIEEHASKLSTEVKKFNFLLRVADEASPECPICFEDPLDPADAVVTNCGHVFCKDCMDTLLSSSLLPTCAICRQTVQRREIFCLKDETDYVRQRMTLKAGAKANGNDPTTESSQLVCVEVEQENKEGASATDENKTTPCEEQVDRSTEEKKDVEIIDLTSDKEDEHEQALALDLVACGETPEMKAATSSKSTRARAPPAPAPGAATTTALKTSLTAAEKKALVDARFVPDPKLDLYIHETLVSGGTEFAAPKKRSGGEQQSRSPHQGLQPIDTVGVMSCAVPAGTRLLTLARTLLQISLHFPMAAVAVCLEGDHVEILGRGDENRHTGAGGAQKSHQTMKKTTQAARQKAISRRYCDQKGFGG
eukprot:g8498.t1